MAWPKKPAQPKAKKPLRPHKVKGTTAMVAKVRRTKEQAYGTYTDWMKIRSEIIQRDGGKCRVCGSTENLQVDHIRPVARGGQTTKANLWTLCARHHAMRPGHKNAKHLIMHGVKS